MNENSTAEQSVTITKPSAKFKTNYVQFAHDEYLIAWPSEDNDNGDDLQTLNTWFSGDECTRTLVICKSLKDAKSNLKLILCKK